VPLKAACHCHPPLLDGQAAREPLSASLSDRAGTHTYTHRERAHVGCGRGPSQGPSGARTMLALLTVSVTAAAAALAAPPRTFGWNGTHLASLRAQYAAGTLPERLHPAMNALKRSAEKARAMPAGRCDRPGPWSVVTSPQVAPSGDPHDLFSFGT
jgi:hypothetical protein